MSRSGFDITPAKDGTYRKSDERGNMKVASLAFAQCGSGQASYEMGTKVGNALTSDITSQDMQNYPTLPRMTLHEHTFRLNKSCNESVRDSHVTGM